MVTEPVLVLSCNSSDYDASTHTCSAPFYSEQAGSFPTLSIADAKEIGLAIALLWATAWVFRMLKRAINEIG